MQHEVLFGHSLAGYYVLWQLFHHQASFQRYIAISPSIWWNEHELLGYASTFLKERPFAYEKLFIGVGNLKPLWWMMHNKSRVNYRKSWISPSMKRWRKIMLQSSRLL